jgi:hypothetical protein
MRYTYVAYDYTIALGALICRAVFTADGIDCYATGYEAERKFVPSFPP